MAKKKSWDANRYSIEEIVDTISERSNSNWGKFIIRARMDDHPSTLDLRNLSLDNEGNVEKIGKGISLSNDEADNLTNLLFEHGYGSSERMEKAIKKRKKMYGFDVDDDDFMEVKFL